MVTAMAVRSAGAGTSEHAGREERSERQRKRSRPTSFSTGSASSCLSRARARAHFVFANATGTAWVSECADRHWKGVQEGGVRFLPGSRFSVTLKQRLSCTRSERPGRV